MFIELRPGVDGLCHISQLDDKRIENIEEVLECVEKLSMSVSPPETDVSTSVVPCTVSASVPPASISCANKCELLLTTVLTAEFECSMWVVPSTSRLPIASAPRAALLLRHRDGLVPGAPAAVARPAHAELSPPRRCFLCRCSRGHW